MNPISHLPVSIITFRVLYPFYAVYKPLSLWWKKKKIIYYLINKLIIMNSLLLWIGAHTDSPNLWKAYVF